MRYFLGISVTSGHGVLMPNGFTRIYGLRILDNVII